MRQQINPLQILCFCKASLPRKKTAFPLGIAQIEEVCPNFFWQFFKKGKVAQNWFEGGTQCPKGAVSSLLFAQTLNQIRVLLLSDWSRTIYPLVLILGKIQDLSSTPGRKIIQDHLLLLVRKKNV